MQNPLPPCRNPSCNSSDVIEDAGGGCVVCTQCGLIQVSSVFENAATNAAYYEGVSRIVVHRYSRIVIIRGILKSLQGETRVDFTSPELITLQQSFPIDEPPKDTTQIKRAIQRLKLPCRLLRHSATILEHLWNIPSKIPLPSESEIRDALALFRALENVWDRAPLGGSVRKGRKKFISMPLAWKFVCSKLGFETLSHLMEAGEIKNQKNKAGQEATLADLFRLSR